MTAPSPPAPAEDEDSWTPEHRALVARLRKDYGAWAALCYHILDKSRQLVRLRLNTVQRRIGAIEAEQLASSRKRARIYILKGRQSGITTDQQARALHACWRQPGMRAMTLADDRDRADKIFEITTRAVQNFPPEILPRMGEREVREIEFPKLDSRFYTQTAGISRARGQSRTGRALTLQRVHGSEFAFWEDPAGTLASIAPAIEPEGTVVVLETTASVYDSEPHRLWRRAVKGESAYVPVFLPWFECDPLHYRRQLIAPDELDPLDEKERDLVARFGLTLPELAWRRDRILEMTETEFDREYPDDAETCWLTGGSLFFDGPALRRLKDRAIETPALRTDEDGVDWWCGEDPRAYLGGERVILGCDVAEGGGGDRSAWVARTFPSWRRLARFASNRIIPEALADLLNRKGRPLRMLLVIEKNGHGITVLRQLFDVHEYPRELVYHRVPLDTVRGADEPSRDRVGWATTEGTKPLLLDAAREFFREARQGTADVPTVGAINDAFSVARDRDGRVDLNGRDELVGEMLAWVGRRYPLREPALAEAVGVPQGSPYDA